MAAIGSSNGYNPFIVSPNLQSSGSQSLTIGNQIVSSYSLFPSSSSSTSPPSFILDALVSSTPTSSFITEYPISPSAIEKALKRASLPRKISVREEEKASDSRKIIPISSTPPLLRKSEPMFVHISTVGITAAALDSIFKQTCLDGYEQMEKHLAFTEYLAKKINSLTRANPSGMSHFEDIPFPISEVYRIFGTPGLATKHIVDPACRLPVVVSYQSWVKIKKNKEIELKLGRVAAEILSKGTTKQFRSIYSYNINSKTCEAHFFPEVSLIFSGEDVEKEDVEDFLAGSELQKLLRTKYPTIAVAPPPTELVSVPLENWNEGIWADHRYDCTLFSALKNNGIECLDKTVIPFTFEVFFDCLISLTDALAIMHDIENIVHKDVKPDNILLEISQNSENRKIVRPFLIDFNLARSIGSYWMPDIPCTYWDELANLGYTSPLTDCFSFADFLKDYFFKNSSKTEDNSFKVPPRYIIQFQTIDLEEANKFEKDPWYYLQMDESRKKINAFSKIENPADFSAFIKEIETFLDLIALMEMFLDFFNLILKIEKSVLAFNKTVKNTFPTNAEDPASPLIDYGTHISNVYKDYKGFKMSDINKALIVIRAAYNEKLTRLKSARMEEALHPSLKHQLRVLKSTI